MKKYLFISSIVIIILIVVFGCHNDLDTEARNLLKMYHLHVTNGTVKVEAPTGIRFEDVNNVSKDIDMDMNEYKSQKIEVVSYLLGEKAKGTDNRIYANVFYVNKNQIIGASLYLPGYQPGIQSLKDRTHFSTE